MTPDRSHAAASPSRPQDKAARKGWAKRVSARLRRWRRGVLRSPAATRVFGRAIYGALRLVEATQRVAPGSSDARAHLSSQHPAIVALWHGQHLLAPLLRPRELPYVALLSRNADAAVNADVVARFGIETVRGSGGRVREAASRKGGVAALIALRRALSRGFGVCMIADVPKGTPRDAGLGIVTLARISGRPILPSAAVTSRRLVLASTWDRTTLPLPFGRLAVVVGAPILVPEDADAALLEEKRLALTAALEAANVEAERLADIRP
ncbi:hypothetical protein ASG48_00520 [Aurantimonas sp. Leaf443]|nr:hypothetical protein ASG48_00520 [Aurantimonas sp. Leaf443]